MKHNPIKHKLKTSRQVLPEKQWQCCGNRNCDNKKWVSIQANWQTSPSKWRQLQQRQPKPIPSWTNQHGGVGINQSFCPSLLCVGGENEGPRWQCQSEPNAHDVMVTHSYVWHWLDGPSCYFLSVQVVIRWIMTQKLPNPGQKADFSAKPANSWCSDVRSNADDSSLNSYLSPWTWKCIILLKVTIEFFSLV